MLLTKPQYSHFTTANTQGKLTMPTYVNSDIPTADSSAVSSVAPDKIRSPYSSGTSSAQSSPASNKRSTNELPTE